MLYHLFDYLDKTFDFYGAGVFQYISFRAIGAAITALFISFLIGPKIIRTLNNHQFGEKIRKTGPDSHLHKEGTPSMGGIIIILSIINVIYTKPFHFILLVHIFFLSHQYHNLLYYK